MRPRCKLWLEQNDDLAFSDYRLRLLLAVEETGSLAAAAARMGLSYRRAWGKLKEIEKNLDTRLVESVAGGSGGGGSRLTPEGVALVRRYQQFADEARDAVAAIFDLVFTPDRPTNPATVRSDRGDPR